MKNAILVLLLLLLPWQSIIAAERNLTHILGSSHGPEFMAKHMAEHADRVLHHHDDDDDTDNSSTHVDKSQKSFQHLADFEQGGSMCILLPASTAPSFAALQRIAHVLRPDAFTNRTTPPLLRPPRASA